MYILPIGTDTMRKEIYVCCERTIRMNLRRIDPRFTPHGRAAAWVLLLLLIPCIAVRENRERSAVPAGANENISIYYIPNPTASQGNESEDYVNSRIIKNYTIRLYEGTIAIFEGDNPTPLYTVDTPVHPLPETDRLLLENGIHTETLAEAYRLIEDYE